MSVAQGSPAKSPLLANMRWAFTASQARKIAQASDPGDEQPRRGFPADGRDTRNQDTGLVPGRFRAEELMAARRALALCLGVVLSGLIIGWADPDDDRPTIVPGTYRGAVRCTGSDHFSNGSRTRQYDSSSRVAVVIGSRRHVRRWTYIFVGRHNLAIQSRAVRAGESFSYAAGAHIGRPGRTRVTIANVLRALTSVEILARLDWSSPSTHYIGSGTYDLALDRVGSSRIRYDAIKVVIKLPTAGASAANPIVRRHEHCVGRLSR